MSYNMKSALHAAIPTRPPSEISLEPLSWLWRAQLSWATCQRKEILNTWQCSRGWTWTLKHKTDKWTFNTRYVCNLGPSCSNLIFFLSLSFQNYPHPKLPFSSLWCFPLTVNIYNLIDVGLYMNFKFCFIYWLKLL